MLRRLVLGGLAGASLGGPAFAAPASSLTQYGVTWTFDREYESGQFVTGDYWVVGPVNVVSVSPEPDGTRNGSCLNPLGGRQGYDNRGGEFSGEDQVTFPREVRPDESLVSSVSRPEGEEVKNVGALLSQAVLTVVAEEPPPGTFRPGYAGTYKRYLNEADIAWELLPRLDNLDSSPDGAELLVELDRPRIDHLSSWTIQDSCAEENWNNGEGAHACYGQQVSELVSSAALYVLLDTPERQELARSLLQHGIDNYGVLRAGGSWAPNGGHHSGRKWPIVFAAALFDDCEMKSVSADFDDAYFGEDGQTYFGEEGSALFGWDCGGGQGAYFESGCMGSGAKDCRDPEGLVDGCEDYRNCCTSSSWVGQMLSAHLLGARAVWNHDAYFDYVDRWMTGDVDGADGSSSFVEAMWERYRDAEPARIVSPSCRGDDVGGEGGASSSGGAGSGAVSGEANRVDSGTSGGTSTSGSAGGTKTDGAAGAKPDGTAGTHDGPAPDASAKEDRDSGVAGFAAKSGQDEDCNCRVVGQEASRASLVGWIVVALFAAWRRGRVEQGGTSRPPGP
jgi:MYXO-CTERM domain-containing protein